MRLIFLRHSHTRISPLGLKETPSWFLTSDRCLSCGGGKGGQGLETKPQGAGSTRMWKHTEWTPNVEGKAAKSCALHKGSEGRHAWDMLKESREGIETGREKKTKDKNFKKRNEMKQTSLKLQWFIYNSFPGLLCSLRELDFFRQAIRYHQSGWHIRTVHRESKCDRRVKRRYILAAAGKWVKEGLP